MFFKILIQRYPNKTYLVPNLGLFIPKLRHFYFFTKFWNLTNLRVLISNITIVFEILAQKYPDNAFFITNLGIFIFSWIFAVRQIWECWIQTWQYCFQIPVKKYPNKTFLVRNLRIFIFKPNFGIRQIRGY